MRVPIPLDQALRLLTPGPLVLASAQYRDRFTVTPIGWTTPLNQTPPTVGVVVRQDRFLYDLVRSSGEIGLSIVTAAEVSALWRAGFYSGRTVEDKFALTGLKPINGKRINAPLVDQAIGHLECAVIRTVDFGDHSLLACEVLAAEVEEGTFDGSWLSGERRPVHYLGGNKFAPLGDRFDAS